MYFWKIEHLKDDIRKGKLNEKERFKYAIVTFSLIALSMEGMYWMGVQNSNIWDVVYSIANISIQFLGILFAYKANNGAKGADFLGKYLSISFVTTMRFLVLIIPFTIGLYFYYYYYFNIEEEISTTALDTIPFLIWLVVLYWRICVHIRQANL
jgi:hypothetical protein